MRVMNIYKKLSPVILGLGLILPGIPQAALNQSVTMESVTVSYADLDLSRDEAVLTFYHRLQKAANEACGNDFHGIGPRIIARRIRHLTRDCSAAALEDAVKQVNNPRLTSLHTQSHAQTSVADR